MGCGFGCCVGVGLGGAVGRFGFGFGFDLKKYLMSVCRSFLLKVSDGLTHLLELL